MRPYVLPLLLLHFICFLFFYHIMVNKDEYNVIKDEKFNKLRYPRNSGAG